MVNTFNRFKMYFVFLLRKIPSSFSKGKEIICFRILYFRGHNKTNKTYPGFMVMNTVQVGSSDSSVPSKTNRCSFAATAS